MCINSQTYTHHTWPQWWCRCPVIIWPAGWWRGWEQSKIRTTECSRTAVHPAREGWGLLEYDKSDEVLGACLFYFHSTSAGLGWCLKCWRGFLTFWRSMTQGRKEEVVSSVMRGRGGECWCSSGCLVSPAHFFPSSSPTKCLGKRLYGALKFLMKASFMGYTRTELRLGSNITLYNF